MGSGIGLEFSPSGEGSHHAVGLYYHRMSEMLSLVIAYEMRYFPSSRKTLP